jgi:D-glycero-D-manno-heptose 1,7-bisphosphate phosphatase
MIPGAPEHGAGAPAVFLDRDGVLIENRPDHVRSWQDVSILPDAVEALHRIDVSGHRIVLVTNQAAIGRGLLSLEEAEAINRQLVATLRRSGVEIDGVFLCPHRPEDACDCRKPAPGLILQAAAALGLDLAASLLVGDAVSDLQAGVAAGVGRVALVRTGRGREQESLLAAAGLAAAPVFDRLAEAVESLLFATP